MRGSRAGSQDYGRGQKGAVYTALSDLSSTRAADTMTDIDDVLMSLINRRVYALLNGDMKDKISIFITRKPQKIGKHLIQFDEGFKTLSINSYPFWSEYIGQTEEGNHYLRLTAFSPSMKMKKNAEISLCKNF